MKLYMNNVGYSVVGTPTINQASARITLSSVPAVIRDEMILKSDDDFELRTFRKAEFLRVFMDGHTLVMTNLPETIPAPDPDEVSDEEAALELLAILNDEVPAATVVSEIMGVYA